MNSDVTQNFSLHGGLSRSDGLYKIVPGREVEPLASWDGTSAGMDLEALFASMRQHGCDYLVVLAKCKEDGLVRWMMQTLARWIQYPWATLNAESGSADGAYRKAAQSMQDGTRALSREPPASGWMPPSHGKALVCYGHSSLWVPKAYDDFVLMEDGQFVVSYTDPLCDSLRDDNNAALEKMRDEKRVVKHVGVSFSARINGEWSPNYSFHGDDENSGKCGLYVVSPGVGMEQVEPWTLKTDGATVRELLGRLSAFKCSYLVVPGCKGGQGDGEDDRNATEAEFQRVLEEMGRFHGDPKLQVWACVKIRGMLPKIKSIPEMLFSRAREAMQHQECTRAALQLLGSLCVHHSPRIVELGVLDAIAQHVKGSDALKGDSLDCVLQLLRSLCVSHPPAAERIVELGYLDAIKGSDALEGDSLEWLLQLLLSLCHSHPPAAERIVELGYLDAIKGSDALEGDSLEWLQLLLSLYHSYSPAAERVIEGQ